MDAGVRPFFVQKGCLLWAAGVYCILKFGIVAQRFVGYNGNKLADGLSAVNDRR